MLMDKNNKTIAYERAECARAVEYMRCMTEDAFMADRFVQIEMADKNFNESVDTKENREILKNLTVESDEDKDEEIQRIVDATHDLSIDEMLGIQKSAGDYEMDAFTEGVNITNFNNAKILIDKIAYVDNSNGNTIVFEQQLKNLCISFDRDTKDYIKYYIDSKNMNPSKKTYIKNSIIR